MIDGNSCFKVCVELNILEVWVEVKFFKNEQEELKALLAGNVAREKTILQKVREGQLWEQIECEEAKMRQGRTGEGQGTKRDIIAKKVGLGSGVNYEHAAIAVKTMDETADNGLRSQLKIALSKPRGVDAAYKLVKPEIRQQRWIPKEGDKVRIIKGFHKDKLATVTVLLSMCALCHVEGNPESKRDQISFTEMEPVEVEQPVTSIKEELKQKQKELGLGNRTQIFPDVPRNSAAPTDPPMQASAINLAVVGDALSFEVAIALIRLTPKQMGEVFAKIEGDLSVQQIEAIWQALQNHFAHKAA